MFLHCVLCVFSCFCVFSWAKWLHSDPEGLKCGKTYVFLRVFEAEAVCEAQNTPEARLTNIEEILYIHVYIYIYICEIPL